MDKYEYRVRADEIKELIAQEEYSQAAEIADTIDWRRVKSVMMLCTISDLYKINRRYEDARDMLLLAYERRPGGKTICYSLCELSIKTEEFVQAVEYYKEFVQVAPKDPGRYILQYKLYEAQDVSLEERIDVLEEFKKRDYREKWAYELAYLYHRIGLATRCVEECDELILWFGEGKYVTKAMELKMLHQPLSPSQQERYDHRFDPSYTAESRSRSEDPGEDSAGELAEYENFQEYFEETQGDGMVMEYPGEQAPYEEQSDSETFLPEESETFPDAEDGHTKVYEALHSEDDELDIYVKPMDMGKYNTLNLQAELAAGLREVLDDDHRSDRNSAITRAIVAPMLEESDTESLDYPQIEEVDEEDLEPETEIEEMEESEVFFGETGEIVNVATQALKQYREEPADLTAEKVMEALRQENLVQQKPEQTVSQIINAEPPKEIAHVLTQESDGQLTLLVPENTSVEKQITGQMNITDILVEWERMKKESEERRKEEVRQRVLEQTGDMFTEFEASVRDGLLEKLENDTANMFDSGEEISDDMTEEILEEFLEEFVEDETEGLTGDVVEEDIDDAAVEGDTESETEEFVAEESENVVEELVEDASENIVEELVEDASENVVKELVEDAAENVVKELVEDASENIVEELVEDVSENAVEELVEDTAEVVVEKPIAEESEDVVEELVEEESEDAVEELVEDITENVAEEFVQESVTDSEEELLEKIVEEAIEEVSSASEEDAYQGRIPESLAYQTGSVDEPSEEDEDPGRPPVRALTKEEKELFAPFIQSRSAREQLVNVVDNINMAAYEGNVIITGEEGMDTLTLAKNIVREVKMTDSNFSGKVAKISGRSFLSKSVSQTISQLPGGALIIQHASAMTEDVAEELYKALQQENQGIIVILEDTKKAMDKFLAQNAQLATCFTARMDVEALSNDTLVAFGRQYAREMEYSIDEFGILALHTKIEERQTIDHAVTVIEVKKLVDDAIRHANRKTLGHFFDVLFAKRYDEEDMIILGEKDFI